MDACLNDFNKNKIPSREHFRPQANKSYRSRIFFSYLKERNLSFKISLKHPKTTYFILFIGTIFFGMLLEH